ncbi:phosphate signaling complex protein PhoU [Actinomarinicola tropica]|uniref:Phosphate-specific transport system accessory protein PhoU n=1 Tax=Actinomarinicola tropica TaxID=2789776 RepID=A0A5Q2RAS3_9ACTN|nr:phosphate signaling complex protein PhoU [Actinomarinicola tropica]QGG93969.1 phosphate signaling complex protein PhoU [Actinomarinicola tropica]
MTETTGEPMGEVRRAFHEELDELRREVVREAALVTEAIPRGTEILLGGDLEGAQALIESDDELDLLSLEIEEHAIRLLTLQQPFASDLRAVVTALKMNGEIERSGDLVINIAKACRRMYGATFSPRCRGIIEQMSEEAARLYRYAIDAYVEGNASLAGALDDMDDRLDALNKDFVQAIFETHGQGEIDLQASVQLALIGRYYERIGDHAVNIGDMVQFMVTGWMPEHTGAARAKARRESHPHPQDESEDS